MAEGKLTIESGFAPIADYSARCLILGSMPSVTSLAKQQYYAHPRNAFWPIMARIFNFDGAQDYQQQCALLRQSSVAVWDVLQACHRTGSLDANIDNTSTVINNFTAFFQRYDAITHVLFNGAKAETLFKQALPLIEEPQRSRLTLQRLPSTSPAHAAMSFDEKLKHWQTAFAPVLASCGNATTPLNATR